MKNLKDKKFVLIDNYLVDVGQYMEIHSGGKNLIEDNMYSDVTRYMNGSVPFNSKFKAWDHKFLTCFYAIKRMTFGEIEDNHSIITEGGKGIYLNNTMIISSSRNITPNTKEFQFQLEGKNEVKFSRYIEGFSWMGKHFSLTSKSRNINRLYSLCLTANEVIHNKHKQLIENYDKLENKQSPLIEHLDNKHFSSSDLELYIKRYDFPNAFSKYLHEETIDKEDIHVKGPLGLGLDLNDGILDGTYIAFSAGTGIYCFLDFVAVVVRKVIHEASKKQGCNNNTLIENEKFNFGDNFKLVLFSAFPDDKTSIWNDILTKVSEIDIKNNIGIFTYYSRISNSQSKRWDTDFYKKTLNNVNNNFLKKVFLCGPSLFLDSIKENLVNEKLAPSDIITLV